MPREGLDPEIARLLEEAGDFRHVKEQGFSEEDAKELIAQGIEIDQTAEKIIAKENAEQMKELLDNQEVRDLEFMILTGQLSLNETMDYAFLVPQIQEIFQLIDQLAIDIGKYVRKNSWVNTLNRKVFKDDKVDARKIPEFYDSFEEKCIRGIRIPQGRPVQGILSNYMGQCLYREMADFIVDSIDKTPNGIERIYEDYKKRGMQGDIVINAIVKAFNVKRSKLGQTLRAKLSRREIDQREIDRLLQSANELSVNQNAAYSETVDGITVTINPFDESNLKDYMFKRPVFLCQGKISIPELSTESMNSFNFLMYRFTGKLRLARAVPVAGIIGQKESNNLEAIILQVLEKHLRNSAPEVVAQLGEVFEPHPEVITAEEESGQVVSASMPEPALQTPEKSGNIDLNQIKAWRIRQALVSLLGEPLQVAGSHHVFKCGDGTMYPIFLDESGIVEINMLKKCLQRFGLTPLELEGALPKEDAAAEVVEPVTGDQREELLPRLSQEFNWGNEKGKIIYRDGFLRALQALEENYRGRVIAQIETLANTTMGYNASLLTKKYDFGILNSPPGCFASRISSKLRFTWTKHTGEIVIHELYSRGDSRLGHTEA